jgi:hypothetical protein
LLVFLSNTICVLKTPYSMKDRRRDRSDGMARKKAWQLLNDVKDKRRYWKLKGEALDRPLWRTRFGRGC